MSGFARVSDTSGSMMVGMDLVVSAAVWGVAVAVGLLTFATVMVVVTLPLLLVLPALVARLERWRWAQSGRV